MEWCCTLSTASVCLATYQRSCLQRAVVIVAAGPDSIPIPKPEHMAQLQLIPQGPLQPSHEPASMLGGVAQSPQTQ